MDTLFALLCRLFWMWFILFYTVRILDTPYLHRFCASLRVESGVLLDSRAGTLCIMRQKTRIAREWSYWSRLDFTIATILTF